MVPFYLSYMAGISMTELRGMEDFGYQVRMMRQLEQAGLLDRVVEQLPDEATLDEMRKAGLLLTRAELGVLLAYGIGSCIGPLAVAAAMAAGIHCVLSTDWGKTIKASLAIGIVILPIFSGSLSETPHGFARPRWVFHYKVLPKANGESSETTAQGTVIRLLERDSAANLGKRFLSQGDHLLTPDASGEVTRRYETLFAASLQGQPAKVLLVGPPHAGSVQELRLSGSGEIHLACDPLELWRTSSHMIAIDARVGDLPMSKPTRATLSSPAWSTRAFAYSGSSTPTLGRSCRAP